MIRRALHILLCLQLAAALPLAVYELGHSLGVF